MPASEVDAKTNEAAVGQSDHQVREVRGRNNSRTFFSIDVKYYQMNKGPYAGALYSFFSLPTPALSGSGCQGYVLSFSHLRNVNGSTPSKKRTYIHQCFKIICHRVFPRTRKARKKTFLHTGTHLPIHDFTAVGMDELTGDIGSIVRCEKQVSRGDLRRLAGALKGNIATEV